MTTIAVPKRKRLRRKAYLWKEGRVALRPLRAGDLDLRYLSWLNDRRVNRYMRKPHYTFREMVDYYAGLRRQPKKNVFLVICDRLRGTSIGTATLRDVHKRTAVFGIMIGDRRFWGKGLGQLATRAVCAYAFRRLGVRKIALGVRLENRRARRVFAKVGFQKTRLLKRRGTGRGVVQMELKQEALCTS